MTLNFYMKSGNKITIKHVDEYTISNRGNEIVGVAIKM